MLIASILKTVRRLLDVFCLGIAWIGACSSDPATDTPQADAGVDDSALATAVCPKQAVDAGAKCQLPEGTTCDFSGCGTAIAQCKQGIWVFANNGSSLPPCPAQPPDIESACPVCWPAGATCVYGSTDCSSPDASLNTSVASCENQKWTLEIRPCRDAGEAGPDVQGDAAEDGD